TEAPHEGGLRFAKDSQEYHLLAHWIAQRCPNDLSSGPRLSRLIVQPDRSVVVSPERRIQIHAEAQFNNGETRDVSNLAVFEAVNRLVNVSHGGLVTSTGEGETTVLVRFLDQQLPVRL